MKRFKPLPGLKRRVKALEDKVSALERELQSAKEIDIKLDSSVLAKKGTDSMRRAAGSTTRDTSEAAQPSEQQPSPESS